VDLRLHVDPKVSPVSADRAKLKRAILNLLVNARQAMPGSGTVTVRVVGEGDSVVIEISDTGCGIREEDQPRLFESFFSTKSEGVGLGLAIVKRTIEDLSGFVDFESSLERGTTFRIVLPSAARSRRVFETEAGGTSEELQRTGTEKS
jgi:signal transduction histidine kinase